MRSFCLLLVLLLTWATERPQAQPRKPPGRGRPPRPAARAHRPFALHDSLIYAVATNNTARTLELLKQGADVNGVVSKADSAGFEHGIESIYSTRVIWLPNWTFTSAEQLPLSVAMQRGNLPMMKLLLSQGANPEKVLGEALGYVPRQIEVVRLLLAQGARPDSACRGGCLPAFLEHNETMRLRGEQAAGRNRRNTYRHQMGPRRDPPLILPPRPDSVTLVLLRLLVEAGANPQPPIIQNAADGWGDKSGWYQAPDPPLHVAVRSGEQAAALYLLTHGAGVNARNRAGATPLHMAVKRRREALARMLLAQGADVHATDNDGNTPLHLAAQTGPSGLVKVLLDAGADPNCLSGRLPPYHPNLGEEPQDAGASPLGIAARANQVESARLLLVAGARTSTPNLRKRTPLLLSVRQSKIRYPAEPEPADPDDEPVPTSDSFAAEDDWGVPTSPSAAAPPPGAAAPAGDPYELVKLLLAHGADPNVGSYGETPLHVAVAANDTILSRLLLERGANPNLADTTGVTAGELVRSLAAFRQVRAHGARFQVRQLNAIVFGSYANLPLVRACLAAGATAATAFTPDEHQSPLHLAAGARHVAPELVSLYLKHGASVDSVDSYGYTPLALAARRQHPAVVEVLLASGANPDGTAQQRPLNQAGGRGSPAVVAALLRKGAHPNLPDAAGQTALHAAFNNAALWVGTVEQLLAAGADPNARDSTGATPLYQCIQQRLNYVPANRKATPENSKTLTEQADEQFREMACLLLAHGARPETPNKAGASALDLIKRHYSWLVFRSLLTELGQPLPPRYTSGW